jgi:hypothetical protein
MPCGKLATMPPKLSPLATLNVTLEAPRNVAAVAGGVREMIVITGGSISGPKINGRIIPGGADWCMNFGNGTAEVWARYAIELDGGSLIMVTNSGIAREQPDGSWTGHTVAKLEAGAAGLAWLNTAIVIGSLKTATDESGVALQWWTVG